MNKNKLNKNIMHAYGTRLVRYFVSLEDTEDLEKLSFQSGMIPRVYVHVPTVPETVLPQRYGFKHCVVAKYQHLNYYLL